MKNILFLTWEKYHRRPELLAQQFNARNVYISYGRKGSILQLPFRYLAQSWESWRVLVQEKPDVVFVQNPPIFCSLIVFLYARKYKAQYIIDSHTGAFSGRWRWTLGLHRLLSRSALVTLVHNKSQEKIVQGWDCRHMVLSYTPGEYPAGKAYPFKADANVAVIGSFLQDEPLDVVFKAANLTPDVHFHVTGNSKHIPSQILADKPDNCTLTGYMSYDEYVGLLRGVDMIMTLIDRDHTLLMGGFEAISLEKPLIVSDWPILRDFFPLGAVFVSNTPEGVSGGVCESLRNKSKLEQGMKALRLRLMENWTHQLSELQNLIGN